MITAADSAFLLKVKTDVKKNKLMLCTQRRGCALRATLRMLILISSATASVAAMGDDHLPRDRDYDYDPPVPGSYSLPV